MIKSSDHRPLSQPQRTCVKHVDLAGSPPFAEGKLLGSGPGNLDLARWMQEQRLFSLLCGILETELGQKKCDLLAQGHTAC